MRSGSRKAGDFTKKDKETAKELKTKYLPKPKEEDFIKVNWYDYSIGKNGETNIDTITEHIHKEMYDIFKTYVALNSFIDGVEVNKGVGAIEFAKRKVKDKTGKLEMQSIRVKSKREAIRKYAKKVKIQPIQIKNILISHDLLVKTGHAKIVNNIYALFHNSDHLYVNTYVSTVEFLKEAKLFDVLNDDTKEAIESNLKELEKYDGFKTIHWHKLRELKPGTKVNMPIYDIDEDTIELFKTKDYAVQTVFTFKKIDDEKCLINDNPYLFTELTIVSKKDEKHYKRRF